MFISLTILGEPASKANSRQLVSMNRFSKKKNAMVKMPAVIKSAKARDYEHDALRQIPPEARQMIEGPCRITIHVFYMTERPDLDPSVILDCLQARYKTVKGKLEKIGDGQYVHGESERVLVQRGVVVSDRQFREQHFYHAIDKTNPRAEIEIEPMQAQQIAIEGWPFPPAGILSEAETDIGAVRAHQPQGAESGASPRNLDPKPF